MALRAALHRGSGRRGPRSSGRCAARAGPISFVERQLAHVWGSGIVAINLVFLVEWLLGLPVLSLITMIAVTNGMLFMVKAGILSGFYYFQAAAVVPGDPADGLVSPLRPADLRRRSPRPASSSRA